MLDFLLIYVQHYVRQFENHNNLCYAFHIKVKDGKCDKLTNSAQCIFDGGDCLGWYFIFRGKYMLKRVEGLFTYQEAILVCESLGAKLFEPKEFDHIKYIWPIIPNQEFGQGLFWTGITDEEEEGKYVEI